MDCYWLLTSFNNSYGLVWGHNKFATRNVSAWDQFIVHSTLPITINKAINALDMCSNMIAKAHCPIEEITQTTIGQFITPLVNDSHLTPDNYYLLIVYF